jgi:hypothetical protein
MSFVGVVTIGFYQSSIAFPLRALTAQEIVLPTGGQTPLLDPLGGLATNRRG